MCALQAGISDNNAVRGDLKRGSGQLPMTTNGKRRQVVLYEPEQKRRVSYG